MTMRPHHMLALVGFTLLPCGMRAGVVEQPHDTGLKGVWRFLSETDTRSDGSIVKTGPAGGYDGLLIFTSSGYMSSTIIPKGRTWRRETVTPPELRSTFEGASAHAGRYESDDAKHTVRMENIVSLDPADEGKWDTVQYRVRGDTLRLSGPWTYNGERLTFTIQLLRLK